MKMTSSVKLTLINLKSLHMEIMRETAHADIDVTLFRQLDEEYQGYLNDPKIYYRWLIVAVKLLKPARILELGSFTGVSTLCFLQELDNSSELISVDIEKDLRFVPGEALSDPRLRLVFGNDLDLSIYRDVIPNNIDFLFMDTDHSYQQISREWLIYQYLLKDGAIVVMDDIRLNDMYKFWEELPYEKLEITDDAHWSGFGVFVFSAMPGSDEQNLKRARQNSREVMESLTGGTS
jgi:predicted O-methyltransferase YrrM